MASKEYIPPMLADNLIEDAYQELELLEFVVDFGVPSIEVLKFAKLPIMDNPVLITK